MAIRATTLHIIGRVSGDVTSLHVDGQPIAFDAEGGYTARLTVEGGTRVVPVVTSNRSGKQQRRLLGITSESVTTAKAGG